MPDEFLRHVSFSLFLLHLFIQEEIVQRGR